MPVGDFVGRVRPTKSFGDKAFGGFHPPYWDRLHDRLDRVAIAFPAEGRTRVHRRFREIVYS